MEGSGNGDGNGNGNGNGDGNGDAEELHGSSALNERDTQLSYEASPLQLLKFFFLSF